jgi:hypothetical protein
VHSSMLSRKARMSMTANRYPDAASALSLPKLSTSINWLARHHWEKKAKILVHTGMVLF